MLTIAGVGADRTPAISGRCTLLTPFLDGLRAQGRQSTRLFILRALVEDSVSKTLLAVDDSVTMRKVIEMTFAGEDIKVRTVSTAQDALAACRKERPDIVLADVA